MISKKTAGFVAAAVAVIGVSLPVALTSSPDLGRKAQPMWAFVALDTQELVDYADTIAVVRAGDTFPSRVVESRDGSSVVPFEITEFEVIHGIKNALTGGEIVVERTGGVDLNGKYHELDVDGGSFKKDTVYLLFLNPQGDTEFYYQINDQSRYELDGTELESAHHEEGFVDMLGGLSADAAIRKLEVMAGME